MRPTTPIKYSLACESQMEGCLGQALSHGAGSGALYPLNRTGPIFYPSKTLQRPINEPIIASPYRFFYPTIILSVKVTLNCPYTTFGGAEQAV